MTPTATVGRWLHPLGYSVVKHDEVADDGVIWYDCRLDPDAPLTYCRPDHTRWQPDRHFRTNFGSIPRVFWLVPWLQKDRFALSYLLHDSGYVHGGLWAQVDEQPVRFVPLAREAVDALLYEGILAEGGRAYQAWCIWTAVRLFGAGAWGRGRNDPSVARA